MSRTRAGKSVLKDIIPKYGTVAEVEAEAIAVGEKFYLTVPEQAGLFEVLSGDYSGEIAKDTVGALYIALADNPAADTKVAARVLEDNIVQLSWFLPDVTGATEIESLLQTAVDLTPDYGTLTYEGLEGTVLVDVPAGQTTSRVGAVIIDHPMTLVGTKGLATKIKDFNSAWSAAATPTNAYLVTSSDVVIDGVYIDANADNHYELDGSSNKWWEDGPLLKRPPSGIQVLCAEDEDILRNITIRNCEVYRPLTGVGVNGDLADLDDPDFVDDTILHSICEDIHVRNNKVIRSRGNSFLFSGGVRNSDITDNTIIDCQYHFTRFYVSVRNCVARGNKVYIDHSRLLALYNETDLGYWRTNDVGTPASYLMGRSGFCVGSIWSTENDLAFNEVKDNIATYRVTNDTYTICDEDSGSQAGLVLRDVQSFTTFKNNVINNPPILGISAVLSPPDDTLEGLVIRGNVINKSRRTAASCRGYDVLLAENEFNNCSQASGYPVVVMEQGRALFNKLKTQFALANFPFSTGDNPTGTIQISDNTIIGYSSDPLYNPTDYDVHGTEGGIRVTLLNGWVNNHLGSASSSNILKAIKNCAGLVTVVGSINGSAATADKVADLPTDYQPSEQTYNLAVQYATLTDAEGKVYVQRTARDGQFYVQKNGGTASRCAVASSWYADKTVLPDT